MCIADSVCFHILDTFSEGDSTVVRLCKEQIIFENQ